MSARTKNAALLANERQSTIADGANEHWSSVSRRDRKLSLAACRCIRGAHARYPTLISILMNLAPITLRGHIVRLEPLSLEHVDALADAGSDPELFRYVTGCGSTRAEMLAFIKGALEAQRAGTAMPFVTIDIASGRPIGSTRFGSIVPEHKRVEIGWTWISPAFQRTGVNTEAKYLMLQYAFEQLQCNRVEFKTNAFNVRSRAAILRIGAKEEGTLRAHMVNPDGSLRDSVYFSVIATEWPEVSARLISMMRR
jgi:N-acetyltransferase